MPATKFNADVLEVRDELQKAEYVINVRRYDLAIDILQKMLREHPENSAVFYTLARAYMGKQQIVEAERVVREALRLDPQSGQVHSLYATILSNRGKVNEADSEYRVSLTLQPDSAYTHYMYAALLLDKCNNLAQARIHISQALALDPAAALHHMTFAKLLALEGKFAEADASFKRALSLEPEHFQVRRVYGWYLLYKRNQPEQAFEQLREALRLKPDDASSRRLFLLSLKAKQKQYRFIWYVSFFFSRGRRNRLAYMTRLLGCLVLLIVVKVIDAVWRENPLYQWIAGILGLLILLASLYIIVCEAVLNRLIKKGRLR